MTRPLLTRILRRCPLFYFLFVIGLSWIPSLCGAEMAGEYQVKAAFFYHFANFVQWPASTFNATNGRLRICVMGEDPFGRTLEETLSSKTVQEHAFEILRQPPISQLQHCHVLFFPASASDKIRTLRSQVAKTDVLIVGETLDFMEQGGMVQFFMEDQKVRFSINLDAVGRTDLQVSSKLLRLAQIYSR